MDKKRRPYSSARETYVAIVLCLLVGIPLFTFFNVLTGGLFMLLLLGAAAMGIFGVLNYFLWGRSFTRQTEGEREEEELGASADDEEWVEPHHNGRF